MNQQTRSLLAGVLSLLVFFLWYQFYAKKMIPPPAPTSVTQNSTLPTGGTLANGSLAPMRPELSDLGLPKGEEKLVVLENNLFSVTFSSYGGRIKSFLLKNFHEQATQKSPRVDLLPQPGDEMARVFCRECNFILPDSVSAGANYRVSASTDNEVTFETESHGILLRKTYQWVPDQYYLTMKVSLENHTNQGLQGTLGLEAVSQQVSEEKKGFLSFLKRGSPPKDFVYQGSGKIERFRQKQGSSEFVGPVAWVGMESQYFLTALINRRLSSEQVLRMTQEGSVLKQALLPEHVVVSPKGRYDEDFTLYLGPKDRKHLELAGVGLEGAVDYGWFGVIAVPIAKLLQFFYGWVRNWGLAIILLTVFVKVLTNPLAIKSLQQMKEMKKLQPEMQRLKEKFKEDKQRLNMEMMQLFKTHKVNPMGGCLPMFLQMPIYIALYKVLYNSIELYHAPFFGFYRDLSGPDPYFILPVLLGVFMVLQQKMTPQASVDPTQKEMMMIMPVMFTAFMLFLPVGLVLYILINTFMSVVQQYMSQREIRWRDLLSIKNS